MASKANTNSTTVNYTGPFIVMVILMFFIGFFTNINQQFQAPLQAALLQNAGDIKNTLATLITFSWFLAYPAAGGIGAKWVERFGYKSTLVKALMVMIGGLAIFECSVLLQQYAPANLVVGNVSIPWAFFLFLLGSFVVGAAVTIMQVVVNPYLIASEVKGTSAMQRQSIGGTLNSLATTIGPLFVAYLVFGGRQADAIRIGQLIVPFALLIAAIAILAVIVRKQNLPNIAGVATSESGEKVKLPRKIWSFRHLTLGVIAIFFYVGVEVCVGANIVLYANNLGGTFAERAALMSSLYWGGMLVGRLISSFFNNISARAQLIFGTIGAMALLIFSMVLNNPWLLAGVGLFHSIMWPALFTLGLNKLGAYTNLGSGALMIGVLGGGVLPLIQGGLADALHGWELTWILVVAAEVFLLYYAIAGSKVRPQDDMTK